MKTQLIIHQYKYMYTEFKKELHLKLRLCIISKFEHLKQGNYLDALKKDITKDKNSEM